MHSLLRRLFGASEAGLAGVKASTPEQIASNDFLVSFLESEKTEIEVSAEKIASGTVECADLSGIDYVRIRNRFKIMSNLDPVVNQTEQIGIIRFSYRSGDSMKDVVIESRFPPTPETFYLKKK